MVLVSSIWTKPVLALQKRSEPQNAARPRFPKAKRSIGRSPSPLSKSAAIHRAQPVPALQKRSDPQGTARSRFPKAKRSVGRSPSPLSKSEAFRRTKSVPALQKRSVPQGAARSRFPSLTKKPPFARRLFHNLCLLYRKRILDWIVVLVTFNPEIIERNPSFQIF